LTTELIKILITLLLIGNFIFIQIQREKYKRRTVNIDLSISRFVFDYLILWFLALIPIFKSRFETVDSVPLNKWQNWLNKERRRKLINSLILIEYFLFIILGIISIEK